MGSADLNDYRSKWAYNNISDIQRKIYDRLFAAAGSESGFCDVSDLGATYDDIFIAYWAFDYENPQFLELGSGYRYVYTLSGDVKHMKNVTIEFGRTPGEISHSKFDMIANQVLETAKAQPSDYERLKFVHDWIVNNTVYLKTDNKYITEADGPLVYGEAICEGYSKAFMYFAQSMGFDCVCVIGSVGSIDHMWNMVKLDGQWYHVDVTWDDPTRSDGQQTLRTNYFLVSDSQIKRDHSINSPFTLPTAPNNYVQ